MPPYPPNTLATVRLRDPNALPPKPEYSTTIILKPLSSIGPYHGFIAAFPIPLDVYFYWGQGQPTGYAWAKWNNISGNGSGSWTQEPVTPNPYLRYESSTLQPGPSSGWITHIVITA